MTDTDTMRAGGQYLRQLREAKELTQQDIERATRERFGEEQRVYAQQVSRIEKGALDKPPILDLLRFGAVLGLEPDDIAEKYKLWPRTKPSTLDPRLREAIQLADLLPFDLREKLLTQIEFAVTLAKAESRTRAQHREGQVETRETREAQPSTHLAEPNGQAAQ